MTWRKLFFAERVNNNLYSYVHVMPACLHYRIQYWGSKKRRRVVFCCNADESCVMTSLTTEGSTVHTQQGSRMNIVHMSIYHQRHVMNNRHCSGTIVARSMGAPQIWRRGGGFNALEVSWVGGQYSRPKTIKFENDEGCMTPLPPSSYGGAAPVWRPSLVNYNLRTMLHVLTWLSRIYAFVQPCTWESMWRSTAIQTFSSPNKDWELQMTEHGARKRSFYQPEVKIDLSLGLPADNC